VRVERERPVEREQRAAPSGEMTKEATVTEPAAPSEGPRKVKVTQPEQVKIPAPPIVGRQPAASGNVKRSLPPQPADEHKQQPEQGKGKGKAKQNTEHGDQP